jgi:hypothetical protein
MSHTGFGGRCETSRLSHCLDNRFIVDGSIFRRPHFTTQNHFTKYLLVLTSVKGRANLGIMVRLEGSGTLNYIQLPRGESNPRPSGL